MDKKLFADLVESIQQHKEIIAGIRKPARETKVDAQSIKVKHVLKALEVGESMRKAG